MKKLVKGLLMAAALMFADYTGGNFVFASSLLVAIAFLLGYWAKNWWFPSVSEDGVFDWRDVASAILIALSVAIPESISQLVVDGFIVWKELVIVTGTVVFTYISGTWMSNAKK